MTDGPTQDAHYDVHLYFADPLTTIAGWTMAHVCSLPNVTQDGHRTILVASMTLVFM